MSDRKGARPGAQVVDLQRARERREAAGEVLDRYRGAVSDARQELEVACSVLQQETFAVAVRGTWMRWDAEQAPGTRILGGADTFGTVDDARVQALVGAVEAILSAQELLAELGEPDRMPTQTEPPEWAVEPPEAEGAGSEATEEGEADGEPEDWEDVEPSPHVRGAELIAATRDVLGQLEWEEDAEGRLTVAFDATPELGIPWPSIFGVALEGEENVLVLQVLPLVAFPDTAKARRSLAMVCDRWNGAKRWPTASVYPNAEGEVSVGLQQHLLVPDGITLRTLSPMLVQFYDSASEALTFLGSELPRLQSDAT